MEQDLEFIARIERLKKVYEPYAKAGEKGAIDELNDIANLVKSREMAQLLITFKQNPWTEKLLKFAVARYKGACERQMKSEIRSELEQKYDALDKEWALFFIEALGGDPRKIIQEQNAEIEQRLKKVGQV